MSASLDYDTGPLNWVRGDIDAALQAALGRVQAYSVDADLTNALRLAGDDAHQVTGALRMVGLEGAATLASALESCLADVNENRLQPSSELLRALRNAMEGLQRWVRDLAAGRGSGELALFPLYKRLRELQGAEQVFEGELFFPDLRTQVQGKDAAHGLPQEALAAAVKTERAKFQRGLLAFLRNAEPEQGLARMREALAAIERIAPSQAAQGFWWACVGFIDSLIAHGVEADIHVKKLLARVDLQMRRLMEGSPEVAERLMREALFFVAKSQALDGRAAEVRSTFGLDRYLPGRGMLDPETLARMRPVLDALQGGLKTARDSWHAYVEGDATQLEQFQAQLARMQPQTQMLETSGLAPLLQELAAAAVAAAGREGEAREQVDLEVAAALLFVQNAVSQEDVLQGDFAARAEAQQARLRAVVEGRAVPAGIADADSQREAERDMLLHMAQEVGQNLKQMEEALDAFFRDAAARDGLAELPALAQQAQGALNMLELGDAANLLAAATAAVQPYLGEGHPDEPTQQRLADAFSSLGLFIEAYCAGRGDADRILRPVLLDFGVVDAGRDQDDAIKLARSGLPALKTAVQAAYLGWRDEPADDTKKKFLDALERLGSDARLIGEALLEQQARAALRTCRDADAAPPALDTGVAVLTGLAVPPRAAKAEPLTLEPVEPPGAADPLPIIELSLAPPEPVASAATDAVEPEPIAFAEMQPKTPAAADPLPEAAASAPQLVSVPAGIEDELLDIFLEEAKEVLATMGEAAEACEENPGDLESLTVVRRAFHTLKGSGRMVGLHDLGEVAWQLEQMMNGWLADKKSASSDLLRLVGRARGVLQDWVNTLQSKQAAALPVPALLAAADRVAKGEPLDVAPTLAPHGDPAEAIEIVLTDALADAGVEPSDFALREPEFVLEIGPVPGADGDEPGRADGEPATAGAEAEATAEDMALPARLIDVEVDESLVHFDAFRLEENPGPLADASVADGGAPAETADEVRIGPISLSSGLYEIFVAEAHQRLAVLQEEVARLAERAGGEIGEQARRAVHTLGGIAGTAGITALAELSHALEQYWNRFGPAPLPAAHLPLIGDAVARLQAMLAAIESAQLPEAAHDLVAALGEMEGGDAPGSAEPSDATVALPAAAAPQLYSVDEVPTAQAPAIETVASQVPESRLAGLAPVFERREVADEIDEQLLPIFLEEAEALVPDTSAQLRAWKNAPGELAARAALRRNLHTIKGSARMVGAMRLGELTHVMESRVIAVIEGQLNPSADMFDTLEAQFDRLADTVDRLKRGELTPPAEEAPLEAPVEPVLEQAAAPAAVSPAAAAPSAEAAAQPAARDTNALTLRVRAEWVDRMVNQAGEVAIARSRIESEVFAFKRHVNELSEALARLRGHIREVEIQAESQMQATFQTQGGVEEFDPLEFDRFTRFQEVTRFLAESVNDISTVQHILLARLGEADAALIQQMRLNRELQQDLLRVRMVPLYSVAERLYRTVRQTARDVGKRAQLDIQGGDLEIDRSVLEKVTAPIEHLLRNALAHGIEAVEARRVAGKPEFGEIVLSAHQLGNEMVLTVKDDGAGLDYARIRAKAEAGGLLLPGVEPTETLLAQMIFAAGFSTAETVSQVAGRGVGMDVVKSEISALGGRIDIVSTPGTGTTFNIYLPLTLAMTQAVMVQAARHDYALPAPMVQQVLELRPEELEQAMAAGEVAWRGVRYPLSYLPHLLGDTDAVHEVQRYNPVVLLASGTSHAAVLVDTIAGAREIVVKNIGPQMARVTGVAGATVGGDGRVILILNPVPLAMRWASMPRNEVESAAPAEALELSAALQPPLVMVVDDSLTVRKITTRLLTREGFRVESAKDGVDALEKMHDLIPDVVLLDVEMPRMDGFELARVMRASEELKAVPIIMITSRTADKHRNRAMEIGVNVYLGKPYQEQQLLDHIAEQIGREEGMPA